MDCPRPFRRLAIAVIPAALVAGLSAVLAQRRPRHPPARRRPQPPPRRLHRPRRGRQRRPRRLLRPAELQHSGEADRRRPRKPPAPAPVQTADPFGEEITLTPKTVLTVKGNATWDSAFETLINSFKSLATVLDKQGIKAAGNMMIVYTSTDDNGFSFLAEIPVDQDSRICPRTSAWANHRRARR